MKEKLAALGPRVFAVPIAFCCVVALLFGTAMTPIFQATPHGIKFAVVNLDKGASISVGTSNIGDEMTKNLLSGEGLSSDSEEDSANTTAPGTISTDSIEWMEMDSEQAVLDAMNAGEPLYGAIVIPEDFTAQQMNSLVGIGNAAELKVLLNFGRNPQTANMLQSTITNMMLKKGVTVDAEMVNQVDLGGGMMSSMMAIQFLCMPLVIMSMLPTLIFFLARWPGRTSSRKRRAKAVAEQVVFALFASLCAALGSLAIVSVAGGLSLPVVPVLLLLWLASFSICLIVQGMNDIALPLGILTGVCIFCLGMGTAMFGEEMMPEFWASFVIPWAPQAALGEGLRQILYLGWSLDMVNLTRFLALIAIGAVAMVVALLIPSRKVSEGGEAPLE